LQTDLSTRSHASARGAGEAQRSTPCKPGCPTCAKLADAALAIIAKAGTEALSHEALELEVGLRHGEAIQHYTTVDSCVLALYDRVCGELLAEFASAFSVGNSWDSALAHAQRRVQSRLAKHPGEARLCFVEPLRGNREFRRRRDLRRQWLVAFLTEQRRRLEPGATTSRIQIELLVGAAFQQIVTMVEAGRAAELTALDARLGEVIRLFDPPSRLPRSTART
jgi:hypothetical protein